MYTFLRFLLSFSNSSKPQKYPQNPSLNEQTSFYGFKFNAGNIHNVKTFEKLAICHSKHEAL